MSRHSQSPCGVALENPFARSFCPIPQKYAMARDRERFGVRWLDTAFFLFFLFFLFPLSASGKERKDQSGVKPPHSKACQNADVHPAASVRLPQSTIGHNPMM